MPHFLDTCQLRSSVGDIHLSWRCFAGIGPGLIRRSSFASPPSSLANRRV
ncbi:hypothetical protein JDM601_3342 [Mycolicibacter sinensis]|uniref:Uncharacterized protein n=1 Tax=Mycolicibacter sinensis (strain JDM601) TaxID=875328 RepID=F5YYM3_MYCSD|nr:hypothetical protein JDM601_3342 [Mycolicibacter sinensis]